VNGALGQAALLVGVVASAFGAAAGVAGARDPRIARLVPRFAGVAFAAAVAAFAVMERAMITRDFSLAYVQKVGSRATPALYNAAAVWSALEGSILLWVLVLAAYAFVVAWWVRPRLEPRLGAWAAAVMCIVSCFFFVLSWGPATPFAAGPPGVVDGPGPNPLLQNHVLVMFHPPMLYLGYVGMTVPFAFAIAALVTGSLDDGWLRATRRWSLLSWGWLTFGIALGGWWSYEVLGWSGVWAWDPVENASLLPWLTGTAYLHSAMVQERRGMLRVWNLSLLVATFSLTILGTFLTRSGVLNSVHAFSESDIGPWLLSAFAVIVVTSVGLIGWRGDALRRSDAIASPLTREGAFLANNLVFALFAFVVLLGTVFPLVVEVVRDRQIVVGEPFFDRLGVPLGLALLALMAIAPALPWRTTAPTTVRDRLFWPAWCAVAALALAVALGAHGLAPMLAFGLGGMAAGSAVRQLAASVRARGPLGLVGRTSGGMIVHLGIICIAVALAASNSFTRSQELDLVEGRPASFAGHTFTLRGFTTTTDDRATSVRALVSIDGGRAYAPAITKYTRVGMTVGTPSVRTGLARDVYLTLEPPVRQDSGRARIKVFVKPMILWLWIGTGVTVLGSLAALVPARRRHPVRDADASTPRDAAATAPSSVAGS
jgi:cytochrome c-type biogenesis protein CcmF